MGSNQLILLYGPLVCTKKKKKKNVTRYLIPVLNGRVFPYLRTCSCPSCTSVCSCTCVSWMCVQSTREHVGASSLPPATPHPRPLSGMSVQGHLVPVCHVSAFCPWPWPPPGWGQDAVRPGPRLLTRVSLRRLSAGEDVGGVCIRGHGRLVRRCRKTDGTGQKPAAHDGGEGGTWWEWVRLHPRGTKPAWDAGIRCEPIYAEISRGRRGAGGASRLLPHPVHRGVAICEGDLRTRFNQERRLGTTSHGAPEGT